MIRKKHVFLYSIIILMFSVLTFAQNVSQIEWLSELDQKEIAVYGDAIRLFALQEGRQSVKPLTGTGVELDGYSQGDTLTKGMLSKMTARYLDLGGSLMYLIFGTERYAYRACVANGIMRPDGSENDVISGPELVEVLGRVSEINGEN